MLHLVEGRLAIIVWNKIDQPGGIDIPCDHAHPVVRASALTGDGIDELRSSIMKLVCATEGPQQENGFLTNVRQKQLVGEALGALERAANAVPIRMPHEMILLDLYSALRPLDDITGATTSDDILNLIFSSFCIGK